MLVKTKRSFIMVFAGYFKNINNIISDRIQFFRKYKVFTVQLIYGRRALARQKTTDAATRL